MVVAPGRIPMVRMVRLTPARLKGLLPYSKPLEAPSVISTDGVFLCRDFAIRQSFGKNRPSGLEFHHKQKHQPYLKNYSNETE